MKAQSPFGQAFQKLLLEEPRYNLKHVMSENCDFSDTAVKSKNCYYCFGAFYCEDVYYGRYSRKCVSCNGVTFCANCEWCTECVDCVHCYGADYCQDCQNCHDCRFCFDCFGCSNCTGCVGLYQKQYCIFNEQLNRETYEMRMKELNLKDEAQRQIVRDRVEELRTKTPNLSLHQFQTEDCIGNHISESKGCYQCYDIFASEDCMYNIEANANVSCCDITVCFETELSYSCVQSPLCYNCNFLMHVDNSKDCEFCAYSRNLINCFGCVYLENKEYHILNKPYSPDEYEKEVARIRRELMDAGQYNMGLYFVSGYEQNRLQTEADPVIQFVLPTL